MNITVYLGSGFGRGDIYINAAKELGSWIGLNGHRLIYGGSNVGLMGILAEAVLKAGGEVIGIEPEFLIKRCVQHEGLTRLISVPTMQERKKLMLEMGEVYVAFPGGIGTLEEFSEAICREKLGISDRKCILYNLHGYYEPMKAVFDRMLEEGFITPEDRERLHFADTLKELESFIASENSIG